MELHQPHDQIFKALMQDKLMVIDYLKAFLPNNIKENIDYTSLVLEDKSYIDELLKSSFSDIIYSCNLKDSNQQIEISILLEHKSYIDNNVPFQLLYYMSSNWIKKIQNNDTPILIVPILFYHGKLSWEYQTINLKFKELPNEFQKFIPNFEYIYNNIQMLSDDEIKLLKNQFLTANLLALKHYFDKNWLKGNLVELFSSLISENKNLKTQFIVYVLNFVQISTKEQLEIIEKISENQKKEIMNTIEVWQKEGFIKGIEKGVLQNKTNVVIASFKKGLQVQLIAEITNLSIENVKKILKENNLLS